MEAGTVFIGCENWAIYTYSRFIELRKVYIFINISMKVCKAWFCQIGYIYTYTSKLKKLLERREQ